MMEKPQVGPLNRLCPWGSYNRVVKMVVPERIGEEEESSKLFNSEPKR